MVPAPRKGWVGSVFTHAGSYNDFTVFGKEYIWKMRVMQEEAGLPRRISFSWLFLQGQGPCCDRACAGGTGPRGGAWGSRSGEDPASRDHATQTYPGLALSPQHPAASLGPHLFVPLAAVPRAAHRGSETWADFSALSHYPEEWGWGTLTGLVLLIHRPSQPRFLRPLWARSVLGSWHHPIRCVPGKSGGRGIFLNLTLC